MRCPNCGAEDPPPPTLSDNGTTTCPKCGHRFPIAEAVDERAGEPMALTERPAHAGTGALAIKSASQPGTAKALSDKLDAMDRELTHPGD